MQETTYKAGLFLTRQAVKTASAAEWYGTVRGFLAGLLQGCWLHNERSDESRDQGVRPWGERAYIHTPHLIHPCEHNTPTSIHFGGLVCRYIHTGAASRYWAVPPYECVRSSMHTAVHGGRPGLGTGGAANGQDIYCVDARCGQTGWILPLPYHRHTRPMSREAVPNLFLFLA